MKHSLSQNQSLEMQQRLSPMQIQMGRMLEMTGPEIEDEVRHKLEELPALEVAEEDSEPDTHADSHEQTALVESAADRIDYDPEDDIPWYRREARNYSSDTDWHEPIAVNDEQSLVEYLESQLSDLQLTDREQYAARAIIGNLDQRGYLTRDLPAIIMDIAIATSLELTPEEVDAAFQAVRSLDPPGVGAVDLQDCMLLQLRRMPKSPTVETAIMVVDKCFDRLAKKHHSKIISRLGITERQLSDALGLISRLNPRPGNQFGETALERNGRIVNPEFRVEPDGDNLDVTLLNNIPRLVISRSFSEDAPMVGSERRKSERAYIRNHRNEAQEFIRTLEKRQATLFNVMAAIARIQRDFFMTGDETKIKPMVLKDIERITGDDLSVISRVTSSKYVSTIAGVYPLKFFFNERINNVDDTTFHQIAAVIRRIIRSEDKTHPMSDDAITAEVVRQGFNVARRTVAKYRERLGYPVARLRKEL